MHRPAGMEVMFIAVCPLAGAMLLHGDGRTVATARVGLGPETLVQGAVEIPSATACAQLLR